MDKDYARKRLEQAIKEGKEQASRVIKEVLEVIPKDIIIGQKHTKIDLSAGSVPIIEGGGQLHERLTDFSLGQLAERLGAPTRYVRELLNESQTWSRKTTPIRPKEDWHGELFKHLLNEHLRNSEGRMLVRSVHGEARGILSDKFKRMDSRPGLDAFVKAAQDLGAEPTSGHITQTRHALRVILPIIYEPVPGEAVAFGLHWVNSDFGNGSYDISMFLMRLFCWNGMVGESVLRKRHLGARLGDDIDYSKKTHDLTQRALASQTTDVVKAYLNKDSLEARLDAIRKAHATEVDFLTAWQSVGKYLSNQVKEAVQAIFDSADEHNVPAGKTLWRFKNALSWVSNSDKVTEEQKLDIQNIAGKL